MVWVRWLTPLAEWALDSEGSLCSEEAGPSDSHSPGCMGQTQEVLNLVWGQEVSLGAARALEEGMAVVRTGTHACSPHSTVQETLLLVALIRLTSPLPSCEDEV